MTEGFGKKNTAEELMNEPEVYEADYEKYLEFVDYVTSDASKNYDAFSARLNELNEQEVNIERLLTGAVGINAEGGELMEIVKKMIFQGKPWNEDNRDHLIIELGDVMWYVAQVCLALNISMDEVVLKNVSKLLKRYPEGVFDVSKSEKRADDDR
jgi:NTP pyrophosphatase (non-canonical NTP hydrolase)